MYQLNASDRWLGFEGAKRTRGARFRGDAVNEQKIQVLLIHVLKRIELNLDVD